MKSVIKRAIVAILVFEAKLLLKRKKPKIIGITGSVGKTTTKDAIYHVLKDHVRTRKSEKSFNSEIGVPLSVLGLQNAWDSPLGWLKNIIDGGLTALFASDYAKVLVLEMGVDRPGDMKTLTKWCHPDIVVLTRLPDVPVHVEYFASPEEVIKEKLVLVEALKPDGVLVYNHDDQRVVEAAESIRQKSIGYGRYAPTDITASADESLYEENIPTGLRFTVTHNEISTTVKLEGVIGIQHTYNCSAAIAVGLLHNISLDDASAELCSYHPPVGRMNIIKGIKETVLIDDTYNSSPVATERALSVLFELTTTGRKIAVLGDMLELGSHSTTAHEKVGEQAAEGVDMLFTVGIRARGIAKRAIECGLDEANVFQYETATKAGKHLQNLIQSGDIILLKGSQGTRLERVVEEIMAEPNKAPDLLVRQDSEWKQRL